jgi:predicted nuclease of restriction endonuclease-like (RecB) superfamily
MEIKMSAKKSQVISDNLKNVETQHYDAILKQIISEIKSSRLTAIHRVNTTMMHMYWNIGKRLSEEGLEKGYGAGVVEKLSIDLTKEFPDLKGFSPRNLWNMKRFYEFYHTEDKKLLQSVAVLSWGHNLLILDKIKNVKEARFYVESAVDMGWTRKLLLNFIQADAYKVSKDKKQHNFKKALPENLQEQADEIMKSSYNLTFLNIQTPIKELGLEKKLIEKIKLFILELGKGFSFIGNQYRLTLDDEDYSVDLLFFNRITKSLIALDLKIGEFKPEYVGKMNFYLGLLDDQVKMKEENPSIGIILCASKNTVKVEIALRDVNKPIGIAQYHLGFSENRLKNFISNEMKKT